MAHHCPHCCAKLAYQDDIECGECDAIEFADDEDYAHASPEECLVGWWMGEERITTIEPGDVRARAPWTQIKIDRGKRLAAVREVKDRIAEEKWAKQQKYIDEALF